MLSFCILLTLSLADFTNSFGTSLLWNRRWQIETPSELCTRMGNKLRELESCLRLRKILTSAQLSSHPRARALTEEPFSVALERVFVFGKTNSNPHELQTSPLALERIIGFQRTSCAIKEKRSARVAVASQVGSSHKRGESKWLACRLPVQVASCPAWWLPPLLPLQWWR